MVDEECEIVPFQEDGKNDDGEDEEQDDDGRSDFGKKVTVLAFRIRRQFCFEFGK